MQPLAQVGQLTVDAVQGAQDRQVTLVSMT